MDIEWLADFLSLAETRSFSRSAEARHVTQPAFSRRIQAVERWAGTILIDRTAYPPTLTPAGQILRDAAAELLRQLEETRVMLRGEQRAPGTMVEIATAHTLALTFFPGWLVRVKERMGDVRVRLVATNVHEAVHALVEGACDFLLCYYHQRLPLLLNPDRYAFLRVGTERLLPLTAVDTKGKPLFTLPGTQKSPLPFLAYTPASFLERMVQVILQDAPERPHLEPFYETSMAAGLKAMLLAGQGVGWVPESLVLQEIKKGQVAGAGGSAWEAALEIRIYHSRANKKPTVAKLWDALGGQ